MNVRPFRGLIAAAVGALLLAIAPSAWGQLEPPTPCCDKVCNADGSSTACGELKVGDTDDPEPDPELLAGCQNIPPDSPLACIGGQVASQDDMELTAGCSCLLSFEMGCLTIGIPPDEEVNPGPAPATPEQCTAAAVAACERGGNVTVTANDPDCAVATPTPTNTPVAPTPTNTPVAPAPTNTPVPPTPTGTPVAPTPTGTPLPPAECGDGVCSEDEECRKDCGNEVCSDGVDNDDDGDTDCEDKDCRGRNRSGGGDDTNPGGGGNEEGFCNPGGVKKGLPR